MAHLFGDHLTPLERPLRSRFQTLWVSSVRLPANEGHIAFVPTLCRYRRSYQAEDRERGHLWWPCPRRRTA